MCQAAVRGRIARQRYLALRNRVIRFQAFARAALFSKRYGRLKQVVVVAQAHRRGVISRKKLPETEEGSSYTPEICPRLAGQEALL